MKIAIKLKGNVILSDIVVADNFWLRLSGYQFRRSPHVSGFMFEPTNAIHTFCCFFPLDLVFLNRENKIVKIIRNMKPWRHTKFYFSACKVIEVPAGKVPSQLSEGETLEVDHV